MRIQYFNGGLANQVFQYIFYRYGQLTTGHPEEWFLDDSFFFFMFENFGYELEKVFGLKPNLFLCAHRTVRYFKHWESRSC